MNERKPGPFCHIFAAGGDNFVYDVNSNELLEVEPVLAAVLPLIGTGDTEEIAAQLRGRFPVAAISEATAHIARAQREEGLFLPSRPTLVAPDPGQAEAGQCDTGLQHLVLSITDRCNMRCRYCLYGANLPGMRTHGRGTMSRETALKALIYFLDRCDPARKPAVSFYGGEPLLAADLIQEVVAAARRHPCGREALFAVDTNGILLDAAARELAVRERMQIQISLDGPKEIHDRHRPHTDGRGSFSEVCANVEALVRLDPTAADRLRFVVTLTPPVDLAAADAFFADFSPFVRAGVTRQPHLRVNEADLRGFAEGAAAEGTASFKRQRQAARETYFAALAQDRRSALGPVLTGLVEPALRRLYNRPLAPLGRTFTPGATCRPGRRRLHVTVDGRYQPCERTGETWTLGSADDGIRPELVQGLRVEFYESVVTACRECWALRLCRVCYAQQVARGSAAADLTAKVCPGVRRGIEEDLILLARLLKLGREETNHLARPQHFSVP